MNLVPRWHSRFLVLPWLAWLPVAIWLTWEPFLWHLEYFRSPGPEFHRLMLFAIPCLAAAIVFYRWFRQKGVWRYEPFAFAAVLVVGLTVYQPRATLITVWIFLAAYGGGRFVRERAGLTTKSPAEEISLSAGIGQGCLIFLLFLMGLLGLYDPWSLAAVLAISVLGFHREIRKLPASLLGLTRSWASTVDLQKPWMAVLVVFAGIFLVCSMMVTLAPSLTHDTLMNHLPAVRFYAAEQALKPLPFSGNSYYPQGFEVLMTLGYVFGGQPAAQMVSPLFFGLTVLLAFAVCARVPGCPSARGGGCHFGRFDSVPALDRERIKKRYGFGVFPAGRAALLLARPSIAGLALASAGRFLSGSKLWGQARGAFRSCAAGLALSLHALALASAVSGRPDPSVDLRCRWALLAGAHVRAHRQPSLPGTVASGRRTAAPECRPPPYMAQDSSYLHTLGCPLRV